MTQKIFTYSLIRAYYDAGKDYIDSFWPFVVMVIRKGETITLQELQTKILSEFSLFIPIHSLKVILTRAKRSGYISQKENKILLMEKGVSYQKSLEIPRDVERRINQFLADAKDYLLNQCEIDATIDELRNILERFLKTNADFIEQYINGKSGDLPAPTNGLSKIEHALLGFFLVVEDSKPALYKTLREMLTGSVISVVLSAKDISEATKGFSKTYIYLDTNIVFSILGLEIDEVSKPAQEMHELLCRNSSLELRVFDFTVEEMTRVLKSYSTQSKNYVPHIKVKSIFSKLKSLKWTRTDLLEYLIDIEKELASKKISIEPTKIKLSKFKLEDSEKDQKIFEYKPEQNKSAKAHDLAAIYLVHQKRRHQVYQLEKAKAIFLTSDKKLANYDYCEWGHINSGTLAEAIPDSVMTNMLWLKQPSSMDSISIASVVSMYSHNLLIDNDVWSRFIEIVKTLRNKGNIDDKDIALLLYDSRMQDELQKARYNEMSDGWVLANAEKVRQQVSATQQKQLEVVEFSANQEVEKITNAVIDVIAELKQDVRDRALKMATNLVKFASLVLAICVVFALIKLAPLYSKNWGVIEPNKDILSIAVLLTGSLLGWQLDLKEIRTKCIDYLFQKLNERLLKQSGVEKLSKTVSDSE